MDFSVSCSRLDQEIGGITMQVPQKPELDQVVGNE